MPSLSVKKIQSTQEEGMYADGNNLYLRVKDNRKSWIFRYTLDSRRRDMGLGSAKVLSLAEARILSNEQKKLLLNNIDPIEYRNKQFKKHQEQSLQKKREDVTFESCAKELIQSKCSEWSNKKSKQQWENTLSKYVYPFLGNRRLVDIDQNIIFECLIPIWNGKTETASRIRQRIESIIDYGKAKGYYIGDNPAIWRGGLEFLLPKPSKIKTVDHHPALDYERLPQFMADLRKIDAISARALELLILTASRTDEIRSSKWSEIDLNKKIWVIPKERMKSKAEHRVTLCDEAIELLRNLPRINDYIFPGSKDKKPLSNSAMSQLLKRMGYSGITVHGFRSTFRDWIAEQTSFSGRLAETAMAHKLSNETEAAYQRRDMIQKRFKMMDAWSNYCYSHNTNVIKLMF